MKRMAFFVWAAIFVVTAACSGVRSEKRGGIGEPCFENDRCDPGLVCVDGQCIEDVSTDTDTGANTDELNGDDDGLLLDHEGTSPDETPDVDEELPPYPKETPTSNQVDDIAANITFYDHEDKMWTLGHFYKKKKLIWLIFSAYDCPYCNKEKNDLPGIYKPEYVARGLEIIFIENGMLAGPQPSKEPAKIAKLREIMIEEYGDRAKFIYGYLKMDMQATMNKYIQQGYPTNALIDGSTMKILNYFEGWDSSIADNQERAIEFWLDEL